MLSYISATTRSINNGAADIETSTSLQKQDTTRSHRGELLNVIRMMKIAITMTTSGKVVSSSTF